MKYIILRLRIFFNFFFRLDRYQLWRNRQRGLVCLFSRGDKPDCFINPLCRSSEKNVFNINDKYIWSKIIIVLSFMCILWITCWFLSRSELLYSRIAIVELFFQYHSRLDRNHLLRNLQRSQILCFISLSYIVWFGMSLVTAEIHLIVHKPFLSFFMQRRMCLYILGKYYFCHLCAFCELHHVGLLCP